MEMRVCPYLMLDGTAQEAAAFYANVFKTKVESLEFSKDWPQEFDNNIPEGYEERVVHAHLHIGSTCLMLADTFPDTSHTAGNTITLMLSMDSGEEARRIYEQLAAEGEVILCMTETSFSPAYACVRDKFGIEWQIITPTDS
ncbi:PhnB protein [Alkalibacterium sp. AK22]|uniref:VOC family protein n=1 Tax=Alkalibacterium sp. AK22 TaxID=1229520 RepID=UPI000445B920|nr:VOC family protein [Alkalibacterium sp. AK22]EXJ24424.1 PhnB protein [Alkalibacterium sp. AK22]